MPGLDDSLASCQEDERLNVAITSEIWSAQRLQPELAVGRSVNSRQRQIPKHNLLLRKTG